MTTAFVLSGGGSLGAVQVGMLDALTAHGVRPDLLVGTSAGALNAAWAATHGTSPDSLAGLATVWTRLHRADVFPVDVRQLVRAAAGRSPAASSALRLRRLVAAYARVGDVAASAVPLHLLATDLLSGAGVLLSQGPLVDGVLASAAIPGVFPPVAVGGRLLVDGVVSGQSGISHAVALGASTIYVLPAGAACEMAHPPRSAVGVALHALTLLLESSLANDVAAYGGAATIHLLPAPCPLSVSPADFGHAAELIRRGREGSLQWLAAQPTDARADSSWAAGRPSR